MKLVAVTSCPTGIAHTYMAAEALEQAAKDAGHEIHVETQGAAGAEPLDPAVIAAADAVIFAADVNVREKDRFAGKPLVSGPVKRGINHAADMVAEAAAKAAEAPAPAAAAAAPAAPAGPKLGPGAKLRLWLMTGVSYMLPFVAAGGILIALAFVIGGAEIANVVNGGTFEGVTYEAIADPTRLLAEAGIAGVMFYIGGLAFSMLVPILAGFIAFGMADRMGIAPGVVGGLIAVAVGAGFLGGVAAGLIAGAIVMALKLVKANQAFSGIMRIVIVPLVSVFATGFTMLVLIGRPIAEAQAWLTDWLAGLSGVDAVLLGLLLGAMMGFDLGGPVNKVAYLFGVGALASGDLTIMAAVMAAGMVPPLGLALATVVRPRLFSQPERQSGKAAWLLGAFFISEGAIPFAAADPLRVIPSTVIGGAAAGAVSMAFGSTLRAPHGGVWVLPLIGNPGGFVVALLAGAAATCLCAVVLKTAWKSKAAAAADDQALVTI
ncbi:PTS fructose transporter subunit IIBC [Glycomyces terrestris]|uniref:PTS fructose transporter subunit IIBC n=1 Tax=Glycomyces terrestris TaxID=2493553 RepID=A0A426UW95_9ACTN|nr:fructose-specific PTS transporter subunit EIIC [Glycomyces terrestris]RRR98590.1 PTS fructose transporter subunit IIBC [Glycomyces terrestris]